MRLVSNIGKTNHRALLRKLIEGSEKSVLCSGWIKHAGLEHLLSSIELAIQRGAQITVYSNKRETEQKAIDALRSRPMVRHFIADDAHRYLHTKLFYFESAAKYTALIGSSNLTQGGLVSNEELSVCFEGDVGDEWHVQVSAYLRHLEVVLRE